MQEITVLVVDDNAPFRDLLSRFIRTQRDIRMVGAVDDGGLAVSMNRELDPDVILMDLYMPTVDGFEATRRVKTEDPDVTVIALTAHRTSESERLSREAGADAFLLKAEASDHLLDLIRSRVSPADPPSAEPS